MYIMVQEALARRFRPAGFEQPEGSRQNYTKPSPELQEAFYRWIDELLSYEDFVLTEQEKRAQELLRPLEEIPYREANALLTGFKPKIRSERKAGLFISACYTHSPEDAIVFDLDAPEIDFIGYGFGKNRVLINKGKTGDWFAQQSSGTIINNGAVWHSSWQSSSGIFINNGLTGWGFGSGSLGYSNSGILIDLKNTKALCLPNYTTYKECDRIPEIKEYLEELGEITKSIKDEESAKKFLERYGKKPEETIRCDIDYILKRGGYKN